MARTARYIGLRTKRYRPTVTRALGGSHGASVPRPETRKSLAHHARPPGPIAKPALLALRNPPNRGPPRAISSGRRPAATPGQARKAANALIDSFTRSRGDARRAGRGSRAPRGPHG